MYHSCCVSLLEPWQSNLSTVYSYHVTNTFQSESLLYSCLSVKEIRAWNRHDIWSWSDCNRTWTYNHLVCKQTSDITPVSSKAFLDTQATIECVFTQKCLHDMIRTYSQVHCTDKYSQHSSVIWPVRLNGWVFIYELIGCCFESYCSHNWSNPEIHLKPWQTSKREWFMKILNG